MVKNLFTALSGSRHLLSLFAIFCKKKTTQHRQQRNGEPSSFTLRIHERARTGVFGDIVQEQRVLCHSLHLYGNDVFELQPATQTVCPRLLRNGDEEEGEVERGRSMINISVKTSLDLSVWRRRRFWRWPAWTGWTSGLSSAWFWCAPTPTAGCCRTFPPLSLSSPLPPRWTETHPEKVRESEKPERLHQISLDQHFNL